MLENPFLQTNFEIHWSQLQPQYIESAIHSAVTTAHEKIHSIVHLNEHDLSYANTFVALDSLTSQLHQVWSKVSHLDNVQNSDEFRTAYNKVLPVITQFSTELYLNEPLYSQLKKASQKSSNLTPIQQRHIYETLLDFEENGVNLPTDKKNRLKQIDSELAALTQKYAENMLDSTKAWSLIITNESDLAGLPSIIKQAAQQDALSKNHGTEKNPQWRLTLQAPIYGPSMQYLEKESLRKTLWEASSQQGREPQFNNLPLIPQILKLRQEKAAILGSKDFSDFVTRRRMAKSGSNATKFIQEFHDRIHNQFLEQFEELQQFKRSQTQDPNASLMPWDVSFWAERYRKHTLDFDEEALRPYFPMHAVIKGLFDITSKVFNLSFKQLPTSTTPQPGHIEVWDPEVQYYQVFDQNNHLIGAFYTDWHPRDNKRSGAWMEYLILGDGKKSPHLGLMCGNLTKPTNDSPSLLTHYEVETIFHEFGHLLHLLCSQVPVKSLSGVNVAWDFVELPSQIMENFCWERISLDYFAHHYQSNQPIPQELFEKLLQTRTFLSALATMRQLSISYMDLALHREFTANTPEAVDSFLEKTLASYRPSFPIKVPSIVTNIGHIFSSPVGYAAGYYSYKWAEVLDADAFESFKEQGVLSPQVGLSFRQNILSQGNSQDPDVLFKNFKGRDPQLEPLLRRSGLLTPVIK